ncbi:acyl-homoserine-lactone synthase [Pseudoalteromonas sp. T1lg65]|uniref:acyl-homoserine-lactone synthase n=1 Tax=Pseudoalteromonas sp. T1lg65 TaxID=2077101 RepID=UPI003F79FF53
MLNSLIVDTKEYNKIDLETKKSIHELRYDVFYKRLQWQVPVKGNMEIDEYDDLSPIFVSVKDSGGDLIGCLRILQTTNNYMLKDTFPELLQGVPAPESKKVLEISRFATKKSTNLIDLRDNRYVLYSVLQQAYLYAIQQGVEEYVMVTTRAMERYLSKLGIPTSRLGEGKTMDIGGVQSVALRMSMNAEFRDSVFEIH